jgi:Methyltransferase domain
MILTDLANKHGTDKGTAVGAAHGYTEIYARYFGDVRHKVKKVLEIGIAGGASLMMWHEYFENATIFGIDHNDAYVRPMMGKEMFIQAVCMEATKKEDWDHFAKCWGGDFDIIIDDGGHFSNQIIAAFNNAWPLLGRGGLYFVEDTHQIFLQEKSYDLTAFKYFASLTEARLHEHGHNQSGKPEFADIEFYHQYKSLLVFKKR